MNFLQEGEEHIHGPRYLGLGNELCAALDLGACPASVA